jgi:hypothetical protein
MDALRLDGDAVVLGALRRRGEWLEVRLVNLSPEPAAATLTGGLTDAREASLLGEPAAPLEVAGGALRLEMRGAQIRTVQVRRTETAPARATVLDASGPRQNV